MRDEIDRVGLSTSSVKPTLCRGGTDHLDSSSDVRAASCDGLTELEPALQESNNYALT